MKINLERFTSRELGALISLITICLIVIITTVAWIFRPPPPDGREALYQIISSLVGLAAGLLGGGTAGYVMGKADKPKDKTDGINPQ